MKCIRIFYAVLCSLILHSTASAVTIRDVVYTTKNAGTVVFSHTVHSKQKGLAKNCRACHDAIFDLKKKKSYSMKEMEKGKSCGTCHNGKKVFGLNHCVRCHHTREITYTVKSTGSVRFSHLAHLTTHPNCSSCHPVFFAAGRNKPVTMSEMKKGKSCGACHNSRQAFSVKECAKCHPVRELVFEEKEAGDVPFSHAFHSGVYTCTDCHTALYATVRSKTKVSMKAMEEGKSCGSCHDGTTAFGVKDKCESCHKL